MDSQERKWLAEEAYMNNLSCAYIQRKTKVYGINPPSNDLGYTTISKDTALIYVARLHKFMEPLSIDERSLLRLGIYTHEALHQIFTNFDETKRLMRTLTGRKKALFAEISNIVEDTRIEYFADQKFGGEALAALRYTIKTIYDSSNGIGKESDPATQVLNALIYLGDLGLVKGSFTFAEAFDCFKKVVPYFEKAVTEPICAKALKISMKITDIISELIPELPKEYEADRRSESASGSGKGSDAAEKTDENGNRKSSNVSKEFLDELDIDIDGCETEGEKNDDEDTGDEASGSGSKDEFGLDEDDDFEDDITDFDEDGDKKETELKEAAEDDDSDSAGVHGTGEALDEINKKIKAFSENRDKNSSGDASKDEFDDALAALSRILDALSEAAEKQNKADKPDEDEKIADVDLLDDPYTKKINNIKMPPNENYSELLEKNSGLINATKGYLKRFLLNEAEEKERHTSGEVNLSRYFDKSYTSSRIFDKRRNNDSRDICVMVLADESGSTRGSKNQAIKDSVVVLSEVCAALNIPCYVMGFSADETDRDSALMRHYTTWRNKKADRTSIASMTARCNNRDGASIRYATSLLKKRTESVKLLFVLSDGLPLACGYMGEPARIDTQLAIREAKKLCSVTGILVGNTDVEAIHKMYGNDFLLVQNAVELPAQLAKTFRKVF